MVIAFYFLIVVLLSCPTMSVTSSNDWSSHNWNGQIYYFNSKTGASQWEPPPAGESSSSPVVSPLTNEEPLHVTPSNSEIKPTRTSRRRHIHKPAIDHREDAHPAPVITSSPSSSTQLFSNKTNYPPLSDSHTNSESQYGDTNGYLNYHSEDISFNSQNSEVLRAYSREALEEDQSMLESMKNFVNLSESMTNSPASIMESNNPSQESDLIIQAKEELLPVEHKSDIKIDENDESRPNSKSSHRNGNLQKDLSDLSKRFTALKRKYNIVCDNLAKSERDRQKLLAQRRQVNAVSSTARVISEPSVATHSNIDVSSDDTINSLPRSSSEKVMEEMNTIEAGRAREVDALRMRLNQQEEELIVAYKELEEVKRLPKHNVTVVKPPITKKSTEAVSEPTKPTKSRISDLFSNFGQMKSSKKAKSRRKLKVDSGADEGSPEQTELTKKERDIIELRQAVDTLSLAVSTLESENAQLVTTAERETDTLRKQLIQLKEEYQADADRLVELLTISEDEIGIVADTLAIQTNQNCLVLQWLGKRLFDLVDKAEEVFRLIQERGQYEVGVLSVRADAMCELAGRQLREIEYLAEMLHESERESGLVQSETASLVSRLHTLSEKCNELRVAEANATTSLARIIEQIEAKKFTWSRITNPFITRIESLRVAMHQFWMEIIKRWTTR